MERMKGFYLKVGDESTCGGIIISGCSTALVSGQPSARMGDNYRCGADGKTYAIAGGVPEAFVEGKLAAGTGHSKGTCRCKCEFVPVGFALTYGYETEVTTPSNDIIPPIPDKERSASVDAGFCVLPYESSPAKYIEKSAKLIKVMRTTGNVGIGLDFASYSSNVYDACAIGREDACRKVAMTEYSKFGGKQLAGAVAGIGFSVGTSKFTEDSGEKMGDKLGRVIYEHFIK